MSEETNLTGEVIKQSKDVLGKAYDDLVHPTAKSVGNTVSLIPRTLGVLLGKWEKWVINGEESIRLTVEAVKEKAKTIPEEKLTEPESYIAVPVIQQLSYCYDSKELREMYANLLVTSMNTDTKYRAHPSYVDIIKQLTPDEAKLLRKISVDGYFPLIDVRQIPPDNNGYTTRLQHFSNVADGVCDYPEGVISYIDNLVRLGMIEIPSGVFLTDDEMYKPLENHPRVQSFMNETLPQGYTQKIAKGCFHMTAFGLGFAKTCITQINAGAIS